MLRAANILIDLLGYVMLLLIFLVLWVSTPSYAGEFIGTMSSNPFDPDSCANEFSECGNPFSANSPKNPFGPYGNPFSPYSVNNPFATNAPSLVGHADE